MDKIVSPDYKKIIIDGIVKQIKETVAIILFAAFGMFLLFIVFGGWKMWIK